MEKPQAEGLKEIGRWIALYAVSFVVSWFITQTLGQVVSVPEFFNLKIWVFTYLIPVRELFTVTLTLVGRFVDKFLHELGKQENNPKLKGGLTGF